MPSKRVPVISAPQPQGGATQFKPLSLPSLDFSLTAGTNIPSPPATPPPQQQDKAHDNDTNGLVRTPTLGGGPLSSHPTTPVGIMPGAYPSTPPAGTSTELKANRVLGRDAATGIDGALADDTSSRQPFPREPSAAALPISPAGTNMPQASRRSSFASRKGSSMRRLFSLRSLYGGGHSNASSSTDCFSGGNASSQQLHYNGSSSHKRQPSGDSFAQPYRPASSMWSSSGARPESRMTMATDTSEARSPNTLRRKRSSAFFGSASTGRRKSGFFLFGRVDEHGMIAEHTAMEEEKENLEPPPTIQEVHVDTSIGGEELFRDIK